MNEQMNSGRVVWTRPKDTTSDADSKKNPAETLRETMAASDQWEDKQSASKGKEAEQSNPFPVDAFPDGVQAIIHQLHKYLGFPFDFIGASIISVGGTAIGNSYAIRVNGGWIDTCIFFIAIVGRPGTAKTPVIDLMVSPLKEKDNESYRAYKEQMKLYKQKPDNNDRPTLSKYIVSDATPEALAMVHEHNIRGLLSKQDELVAFLKNFNKYHGGAEQENWLSIWSGQDVIIDRKTTDSTRISRPCINVLGGIQPGVLNRMAANDGEYNGWMDRFLFAYPKEAKKKAWEKHNGDVDSTIHQWRSIINKLLELELITDEYGNPEPKVMDFAPEAWELLKSWQKENTERINDEDEIMAGVLVKMEQYTVRLSLLLQMLAHGTGGANLEAIELSAVEGAIKLAIYFTQTAERVRNVIGGINQVEELTEVNKQYYNDLPKGEFTTDTAMEIACKIHIPERTAKRFIANKSLFKKIKHGIYSKI